MSSLKRRKKPKYYPSRYWYHLSKNLTKEQETLIPWGEDKAFNRDESEPVGKRICVSPTIEQCITAIPYTLSSVFTIYRTKKKIKTQKPRGIFDSKITGEGWIKQRTSFVRIGILNFENLECQLKIDRVIGEAATMGDRKHSKKVLNWWKKARIRRFIKKG